MEQGGKKRKTSNTRTYPVEELFDQSFELFGVNRAAAVGSMSGYAGNRITIGQMKQRIDQFMMRKVSE